jgi:hypothetical protein
VRQCMSRVVHVPSSPLQENNVCLFLSLHLSFLTNAKLRQNFPSFTSLNDEGEVVAARMSLHGDGLVSDLSN